MSEKDTNGSGQDEAPRTSRFERLTKILDVASKVVAAGAIAAVSWVAANYESKVSSISLLSQREQAESNLSATMFSNLIDPILGNPPAGTDIDPDRNRVLIELLTLNFHHVFEFKPLLLDIDQKLAEQSESEGRNSLESIARRVIDRQFSMLRAAATSMRAPIIPPRTISFYVDGIEDNILEMTDLCHVGAIEDPAPYYPYLPYEGVEDLAGEDGEGASDIVCIASANDKYLVTVSLSAIDWKKKNVSVTVGVIGQDRRPEPPQCDGAVDLFGPKWCRKLSETDFTLTQFDFPLTDNAVIDPEHRFALVLWDMTEDDPSVVLKFVWFPAGFITARERPLHFQEIRSVLGLKN